MALVAPLDVVGTGTGTRQEDDVGVEPVDIEVIPIKALARPQGHILERALEAGQSADLGKGLADIQVAGAAGPVVIAALTIGHHHLETGGGAVIQLGLLLQIHFHIGIRLVTQTTHCATGGASRCQIGTAFGAGTVIPHQQAGTGIAMKLDAGAQGALGLHGRALGHRLFALLTGLAGLLFGAAGTLFSRRCFLFSLLGALFRRRQTLLQRTQARFQGAALLGRSMGSRGTDQGNGTGQIAGFHRHHPQADYI